MRLSALLPDLAPVIAYLPTTPLALFIRSKFFAWEATHMATMAILGGTTLLMNLRLMGVTLTTETSSEVQRNLRTWTNVGLIGILITGLFMFLPDARRLYNSVAFPPKMLALLAGVIFTYGVTGPVARAEGVVSNAAKAWWLAGTAVLTFALYLMATSRGLNPASFHVITATALVVLFVTPGRARWVFLGVTLLLWAAQTIGTHYVVHQDDFAHLDPTNKKFAVVFAVWILGFAAYQMFWAKRGPDDRPLTKAMGYTSIAVWVVAGAAGRWIAFSG